MLTHRQLRYFVEIVDAGSFSLAAERLFIAQSALSRQVREMEHELQVPLLERSTRHLMMTPAGRSLYTDARRILVALHESAARASQAQRGVEGTIRLQHSSSVPLTSSMLAVLRRHVEQHPGVSVEISQDSSEHQALDLHEGRSDVGLARAPVLRRYGDVEYHPLYEEPLVAVVAAHHSLAGRTEVSVGELRQERFVAIPHLERGGLSHRVSELCRAHGFRPEASAVRSRKWAQLALVEAGFGIAIVPRSMAALAPHGVRVLTLRDQDCTTQVLALWRHDAPILIQRFVHELQTAFGGQPTELS